MKPSPPFVYKPGGSTLHRDVTPALATTPSPPLSLLSFALTLSALFSYPSRIFTTLWEEAPPTDFHVSHPIKFNFKQKHFSPQWHHICATSLAVASPRRLRTEKPSPEAAPNRLQHRLPFTSTRQSRGSRHRRQARERHSVKINARIATIPLQRRHPPSVIRPMIHVILTTIAARPSIGLRATTSHILI
jgi:hypothetical protein